MLGIIFYNIIELLNYYLTYKVVMNIHFTKHKLPYIVLLMASCIAQLVAFCYVGDAWRDKITFGIGIICAIILTESKKWKVVLLFPLVFFLPSLINVLGSYGLAVLLGITQRDVCESIWLTCVAECTGIILLSVYGLLFNKKDKVELRLSIGQYILLILGASSFFVIIGFSQGVLRNEWSILYDNRNILAYACLAVAICFFLLSSWQQMTQKKAYKYQMENEKYEIFLSNQEKHIHMLIAEDERKRKLRHDMNAHMLAMSTMIEKEQWEELQQYFQQMKESLEEVKILRYTSISAVDAIVSEWHNKATDRQVLWIWEGNMIPTERITIFELCTLFSNLLSNATEAVERASGEKKIHVKVASFQEKIVLSIGNSCEPQMETNARPKTSKKDETIHGLGLRNVEEIVNKHDGRITYQAKAGWFQVEIIL